MKVCFISHSSWRGGAELSMLALMEVLSERGMECVCVLPDRGPLADLLADRGIETIVVPFKQWVHHGKSSLRRLRRMLPLRHLRATMRLASVIKRSRCDVVYTNTIAVGVGAFAAKIARKPHLWHIREFGYDDHRLYYDLGESISRRLIGRLSAAVIANSKAVAKEYRRSLGGTEVSVVYNSVEMPNLIDAQPSKPPWRHNGAIRCILLGKLVPGKGQEDAVRAIAHLRQMGVPAELLLLGGVVDQEYNRDIERIIDRHDLTGRVHRLDHCDNPMPLMNTADIVLMCSRREAFGRVTVEGMMLGKPVIGTRCGGTPEIVHDGRTGVLYTPGKPEELAARIGQLHANPSTRESMGAEGLRRARVDFHRDKYGQAVESILERVVRRHRHHGKRKLHNERSPLRREVGANDTMEPSLLE